jgi:hypothetical protein
VEIRLVKGWFGIGQEVCSQTLDTSVFLSGREIKHKGKIVPSPKSFKTGGAFARTASLTSSQRRSMKVLNL